MTTPVSSADRFRALQQPGQPLLLPNPWDPGSARLFASLGFEAFATTSSGFAGTLGRRDGSVTADEALAHAAAIAAATDLPVTADLENGFARDPAGVAAIVGRAVGTGVAGCSIEDYDPGDQSVYDLGLAVERVAAAVEAAHAGPGSGIVITARAENYIRGHPDLSDTIARLQAYQEVGAEALYAPGLMTLDDIRQLVAAVDRPVNVLARPGAPTVAELAGVGVARISVGGAFSYVALAAAAGAARELLDQGTYGFWEQAAVGMGEAHAAFTA